jgi:hypothetical protein
VGIDESTEYMAREPNLKSYSCVAELLVRQKVNEAIGCANPQANLVDHVAPLKKGMA